MLCCVHVLKQLGTLRSDNADNTTRSREADFVSRNKNVSVPTFAIDILITIILLELN